MNRPKLLNHQYRVLFLIPIIYVPTTVIVLLNPLVPLNVDQKVVALGVLLLGSVTAQTIICVVVTVRSPELLGSIRYLITHPTFPMAFAYTAAFIAMAWFTNAYIKAAFTQIYR